MFLVYAAATRSFDLKLLPFATTHSDCWSAAGTNNVDVFSRMLRLSLAIFPLAGERLYIGLGMEPKA